jgi:peptide/nickel transport system permease protein
MARYVLHRLLQAVPTLLLASAAIFVLLRLVPGDPAIALAGPDATPETLGAIRHELGTDQPVLTQYLAWLHQLVVRDLGQSIQARRPVADLLGQALPATIQLIVSAMLLAVVLGGALGILAAVHRGRGLDLLIGAANAILIGVPSFWLGLLVILVFSVLLGWLPAGGRVDPLEDPAGAAQSLVLPAVVLGLGHAAVIARFTRSATLDVLNELYVQTALGKGLSRSRVVWRHVLPNALIPVVTVIAIQIGHLFGGAVLVETVFAWPGMGRLLVTAIMARDYPVVQGVIVVLVGAFIVASLCADLLYGVLDPRLRETSG